MCQGDKRNVLGSKKSARTMKHYFKKYLLFWSKSVEEKNQYNQPLWQMDALRNG
jgi:hypothetical protein